MHNAHESSLTNPLSRRGELRLLYLYSMDTSQQRSKLAAWLFENITTFQGSVDRRAQFEEALSRHYEMTSKIPTNIKQLMTEMCKRGIGEDDMYAFQEHKNKVLNDLSFNFLCVLTGITVSRSGIR